MNRLCGVNAERHGSAAGPGKMGPPVVQPIQDVARTHASEGIHRRLDAARVSRQLKHTRFLGVDMLAIFSANAY